MLYAILGTSRMEEAMVKAIVGANWEMKVKVRLQICLPKNLISL